MTTIFEEENHCSVCGSKSVQAVIRSTNTMGPPDLDTRPAEMERSTINYWIQTCPSCGFCYPDPLTGSFWECTQADESA